MSSIVALSPSSIGAVVGKTISHTSKIVSSPLSCGKAADLGYHVFSGLEKSVVYLFPQWRWSVAICKDIGGAFKVMASNIFFLLTFFFPIQDCDRIAQTAKKVTEASRANDQERTTHKSEVQAKNLSGLIKDVTKLSILVLGQTKKYFVFIAQRAPLLNICFDVIVFTTSLFSDSIKLSHTATKVQSANGYKKWWRQVALLKIIVEIAAVILPYTIPFMVAGFAFIPYTLFIITFLNDYTSYALFNLIQIGRAALYFGEEYLKEDVKTVQPQLPQSPTSTTGVAGPTIQPFAPTTGAAG